MGIGDVKPHVDQVGAGLLRFPTVHPNAVGGHRCAGLAEGDRAIGRVAVRPSEADFQLVAAVGTAPRDADNPIGQLAVQLPLLDA